MDGHQFIQIVELCLTFFMAGYAVGRQKKK